ncbi:MAG TPA: hypothetical protein VGW12_11780 [Pyrinomonadaceae bacterium]|nr:hypothetical protein [Pyrinomonadaceae bacterium]
MLLRKLCCSMLLLFTLHASAHPAQEKKEQRETKPRDLNRYEIGERYELSWRDPKEIEELKLKARDYLWRQWQQKRLTYFLVADCLVYPEGCDDSIEYKIYIEPDEKGRWLVVIESERVESAWMLGKDKEERTPRGRSVYSEVKKLEARQTSACWPLFNEQRVEPPPNFYRLLLTDKASSKDNARPACIEF